MKRDLSDADLTRGILRGDERSSAELFRRYNVPLFQYVLARVCGHRPDAEDVCQDIFVDAWKDLQSYDRERSFWLWLCGLARRRLAKFARRRSSPAAILPAALHLGALIDICSSAGTHPFDRMLMDESRSLIRTCFSALGPRDQMLLREKYVHERSAKAIADELGTSAPAIDSALQRARAAFGEELSRAHRGEIS
jgi:RNA polymerase sigma-70 factor, ECF subfamily